MSKLSVRTHNNSSPQGKPRVYFSCHPEDFEKFFETICADIFATQDCAIYYESDWENKADEEEVKLNLSDMQMFVIPITTKFLTEDCRARLFEYGFAMEKHIPILPIAMEGGLERVFADKLNAIKLGYGDVQYLDRTSKDNTQISYAEKLEGRLSSILIGNKLAKRVRAAFDAYIFLSYRKKDRAMAKELMSLIHRIPFCRDIAIWYDEFLIPGEAWNSAIAEALKKSSLVTLMVTPSIVEPGNFIIEHEYPDAVAAGKAVLPAEVKATDRDALFRLFEGISMPFDACNLEVLTEKLTALAVTNNDSSPEHNYLIGLAYLGAIDVERDYERAVELITSAAEAGLPEAMEKLADMYNSGEGVERNYNTALEWMEKCCKAMESANGRNFDYMFALQKCGIMWDSAGQIAKAREKFEVVLETYESLAKEKGLDGNNNFQARIYGLMGYIYEKEGRLSDALAQYEIMLEISRNLAGENVADAISRESLSLSYCKVGGIYEAEGRLGKALECYEKALVINKALVEETKTVESRRALSLIYGSIGYIYEQEGRSGEALEQYERMLEISKTLAEETGTVLSRRNLMVSYDNVGGIYEDEGKLDEALHFYVDALVIAKALVEETGTVESRQDMCVNNNNVGYILERQEKWKDASIFYMKALELANSIAEETGTIEARVILAECHSNVGGIYEAEGRLEEALLHYERALAIRRVIAGETGTIEARRSLAINYNDVGGIYKAQGRLKEALVNFESALAIRRAIAEKTGTEKSRDNLALSYNKVGRIYEAQGRLEEALLYYEKALLIRKVIAEKNNTIEAYSSLSVCYDNVGGIYEELGRLNEALAIFEKNLAIYEVIAKEEGTEETYDDLSYCNYMIGKICAKLKRHKDAKAHTEIALVISKTLFEQTGDSYYQTRVSDCEEILRRIRIF